MRGKWRVEHQVKRLEALKSDIHVLTEVHHDLMLHGQRAVALSHAGLPPYRPTDRATGIWTSLPVGRDHPVRTPGLAACVELDTPLGPTLVYATILPYRDDQVKHGCERWQRHRETLAFQMADWKDIRQRMPDHHLVIAGDFNMTMGNENAYVDTASRSQLLTNCDLIGLRCVTDADFRPLVGRANIDHLPISPELEHIYSGSVFSRRQHASLHSAYSPCAKPSQAGLKNRAAHFQLQSNGSSRRGLRTAGPGHVELLRPHT